MGLRLSLLLRTRAGPHFKNFFFSTEYLSFPFIRGGVIQASGTARQGVPKGLTRQKIFFTFCPFEVSREVIDSFDFLKVVKVRMGKGVICFCAF